MLRAKNASGASAIIGDAFTRFRDTLRKRVDDWRETADQFLRDTEELNTLIEDLRRDKFEVYAKSFSGEVAKVPISAAADIPMLRGTLEALDSVERDFAAFVKELRKRWRDALTLQGPGTEEVTTDFDKGDFEAAQQVFHESPQRPFEVDPSRGKSAAQSLTAASYGLYSNAVINDRTAPMGARIIAPSIALPAALEQWQIHTARQLFWNKVLQNSLAFIALRTMSACIRFVLPRANQRSHDRSTLLSSGNTISCEFSTCAYHQNVHTPSGRSWSNGHLSGQ